MVRFSLFYPFDFDQETERSHLTDSYVTKQCPKEKCSEFASASGVHLTMFVKYPGA